MIEGLVFDIARCSFHDGPGIRTTVFLKGCPLDCKWCHNPESKEYKPQISINPNTGREEIIGKWMNIDNIMEIVIKDKIYYEESGGGMTISGGEPMYQFDFTYMLAKRAKHEGIHVAMETSGASTIKKYEMLRKYIDLFLFDYKLSDSKEMKKYTKGDSKQIEECFKYLYKKGSKITRRCPIIPGINDNEEHFKKICEMSIQYKKLYTIELLLYNNLGVSKAKSIGVEYPLEGSRDLNNSDDIHRIKGLIKKYSHRKIILKGKEI